jgi:hypothetical protein
MFIKEKFDLAGKFLKLKARLVADGRGEDRTLFKVSDINSHTVSLSFLLTIASVAAAKGLYVVIMDVGSAYLNAEMKDDVYVYLQKEVADILIKQDPSFVQYIDYKGQVLVKLKKGQYGCIESARLWYNTISAKMVALGYDINPYDGCVFTKKTERGQVTVCLYVDDIFATAESKEDLEQLIGELTEEYKALTVTRGKIHEYVGMLFEFGEKGTVHVTTEKYTDGVLEECGVETDADTSAAANLFEVDLESKLLTDKERKTFHRHVAQLLYMAVRTRSDILLPIIFLSTRVREPRAKDAMKLRRVLRYLYGTEDLGIVLGANGDGTLCVVAYCDASYGVHMDSKSHSGTFIPVGRGPIMADSV